MKLLKTVFFGSLIASLTFGLMGCGNQVAKSTSSSTQSTGKSENILIGTAGEGGSYFYIGNGIADVINKNTQYKATAQSTAGGVENLRRMNNQDMDFGFAATNDLESTLNDNTMDPAKVKVVSSGHTNIFQIVVRADSDIKSVEQLFTKGKRIGIGEPGSAIQVLAENLLSVYGLTREDIKAAPFSQSEQANALKDSTIDGAIFGGGIPTSSISDLATTVGARILPVSNELIEKLKKKQPDLFSVKVPGGSYKGIDQPVQVYGSSAVFLVRADLPEEMVYEVLKSIHKNTGQLSKIHPSGAEYTIEHAFRGADYYSKQLGMKFHPGAIKWYKENGVWNKELE